MDTSSSTLFTGPSESDASISDGEPSFDSPHFLTSTPSKSLLLSNRQPFSTLHDSDVDSYVPPRPPAFNLSSAGGRTGIARERLPRGRLPALGGEREIGGGGGSTGSSTLVDVAVEAPLKGGRKGVVPPKNRQYENGEEEITTTSTPTMTTTTHRDSSISARHQYQQEQYRRNYEEDDEDLAAATTATPSTSRLQAYIAAGLAAASPSTSSPLHQPQSHVPPTTPHAPGSFFSHQNHQTHNTYSTPSAAQYSPNTTTRRSGGSAGVERIHSVFEKHIHGVTGGSAERSSSSRKSPYDTPSTGSSKAISAARDAPPKTPHPTGYYDFLTAGGSPEDGVRKRSPLKPSREGSSRLRTGGEKGKGRDVGFSAIGEAGFAGQQYDVEDEADEDRQQPAVQRGTPDSSSPSSKHAPRSYDEAGGVRSTPQQAPKWSKPLPPTIPSPSNYRRRPSPSRSRSQPHLHDEEDADVSSTSEVDEGDEEEEGEGHRPVGGGGRAAIDNSRVRFAMSPSPSPPPSPPPPPRVLSSSSTGNRQSLSPSPSSDPATSHRRGEDDPTKPTRPETPPLPPSLETTETLSPINTPHITRRLPGGFYDRPKVGILDSSLDRGSSGDPSGRKRRDEEEWNGRRMEEQDESAEEMDEASKRKSSRPEEVRSSPPRAVTSSRYGVEVDRPFSTTTSNSPSKINLASSTSRRRSLNSTTDLAGDREPSSPSIPSTLTEPPVLSSTSTSPPTPPPEPLPTSPLTDLARSLLVAVRSLDVESTSRSRAAGTTAAQQTVEAAKEARRREKEHRARESRREGLRQDLEVLESTGRLDLRKRTLLEAQLEEARDEEKDLIATVDELRRSVDQLGPFVAKKVEESLARRTSWVLYAFLLQLALLSWLLRSRQPLSTHPSLYLPFPLSDSYARLPIRLLPETLTLFSPSAPATFSGGHGRFSGVSLEGFREWAEEVTWMNVIASVRGVGRGLGKWAVGFI